MHFMACKKIIALVVQRHIGDGVGRTPRRSDEGHGTDEGQILYCNWGRFRTKSGPVLGPLRTQYWGEMGPPLGPLGPVVGPLVALMDGRF